jgi:hypothetical protein
MARTTGCHPVPPCIFIQISCKKRDNHRARLDARDTHGVLSVSSRTISGMFTITFCYACFLSCVDTLFYRLQRRGACVSRKSRERFNIHKLVSTRLAFDCYPESDICARFKQSLSMKTRTMMVALHHPRLAPKSGSRIRFAAIAGSPFVWPNK